MKNNTKFTLHPNYQIGIVDPRLYGSFIKHFARAVYGGHLQAGSSFSTHRWIPAGYSGAA
jgi:alpha-N-arabinofuranosidase